MQNLGLCQKTQQTQQLSFDILVFSGICLKEFIDAEIKYVLGHMSTGYNEGWECVLDGE